MVSKTIAIIIAIAILVGCGWLSGNVDLSFTLDSDLAWTSTWYLSVLTDEEWTDHGPFFFHVDEYSEDAFLITVPRGTEVGFQLTVDDGFNIVKFPQSKIYTVESLSPWMGIQVWWEPLDSYFVGYTYHR